MKQAASKTYLLKTWAYVEAEGKRASQLPSAFSENWGEPIGVRNRSDQVCSLQNMCLLLVCPGSLIEPTGFQGPFCFYTILHFLQAMLSACLAYSLHLRLEMKHSTKMLTFNRPS